MSDDVVTAGGSPTDVPDSGSAGADLQSQASKPIDLSDDTLIAIKGSNKPVKFGEHNRNLQSQWTKASQRAAQLERDLQAEKQARAQLEQAQREAASRQQAGGQADVFAQLRQLPYLTGEDAVSVVQSIGEQMRYRDRILLSALQQVQKMQQIVSTLSDTHSMGAFDTKINKWLTDGGFPAEAADLAKEIYLAYEGDDLDEDFPRIFQERWEQVQRIIEAQKAAKVQAARRQPFLPGRGGATGPSKPQQLDPRLNNQQLADALWDGIQTGDGT